MDREKHVLMILLVFQSISIQHPKPAAASVCVSLSSTLVSGGPGHPLSPPT